MAKANQATLSRDESNILVAIGKLETQMDGMRIDIAGARAEIKEINTGITARLLNLEGNAVSRVVVEAIEQRVDALEESRTEYRTQLKTWGVVWGVATFAAPILLTLFLK